MHVCSVYTCMCFQCVMCVSNVSDVHVFVLFLCDVYLCSVCVVYGCFQCVYIQACVLSDVFMFLKCVCVHVGSINYVCALVSSQI